MPDSLIVYELLKRLPGYTAQALFAEDATLIEDFMRYMEIEAQVKP